MSDIILKGVPDELVAALAAQFAPPTTPKRTTTQTAKVESLVVSPAMALAEIERRALNKKMDGSGVYLRPENDTVFGMNSEALRAIAGVTAAGKPRKERTPKAAKPKAQPTTQPQVQGIDLDLLARLIERSGIAGRPSLVTSAAAPVQAKAPAQAKAQAKANTSKVRKVADPAKASAWKTAVERVTQANEGEPEDQQIKVGSAVFWDLYKAIKVEQGVA